MTLPGRVRLGVGHVLMRSLQCSTSYFLLTSNRARRAICIVGPETLAKGILSAPGDMDVTGDPEKIPKQAIGDKPS
jgi:hypothetical protein